MKKFFQYLLLIILFSISGIILTNRESSRVFFQQVRREYIEKPCTKPIKYSVGIVDPRFGITQASFQNTILEAENIWEKAIGKDLFQYDAGSQFKINMIYDDRQERTEESQKLENKLETLEDSHEAVVGQYNNLSGTYKKRLSAYKKAAADYEKKLEQYNDEVDSWNAKGGAPEDVVSDLKKEKRELQDIFSDLEKERKAINGLIGKTNELVEKEKTIINNYNSNLASYKNKYGESVQFDKGVYDGEKIDIFQFNEIGDLRLTIAHEFGHALGIDHLSDPQSLMYYLMGEQDMDNPQLSPEDIAALKGACMIK